MLGRTVLTLAALTAATPMLGCSASLRRGLTTTEASTGMEQVTRSATNERHPAVSPDGKILAFEVADAPDAKPHIEGIRLADVGSPGAARISYAPGGATGSEPAWMPDSSGLLYLTGSGSSTRLVQTFGLGPEKTEFVADAGNASFPGTWPSMSPDGKHVAMSVPRLELFKTGWRADLSFDAALGVSDLFGSGLTILGEGTTPAWSPDGRQLVFARRSGGRAHLFVAKADGTGATPITDGPQDDVEPAWSPDGKSIAFCSGELLDDGTRHANIFVVHADGSGLHQLTEGDHDACRPSWSRDGFIYFHADATDRFHIWRLRLRAGAAG